HLRLMAQYNHWMNQSLYAAAAQLSEAQLQEDKQAFFSSIFGTLNHIIVADIIWLKRFAKHPANHLSLEPIRLLESPKALSQIYYNSLEELQPQRLKLDKIIVKWCDELTESDISYPLPYNRMNGEANIKVLESLIIHFFNHQTHHRGQLTTLLSQEGIDVGVTDLLMLIPDESISL
ncbi:MAG: DinB family protein, partial [Coleofasciculaceae cyanobacterium]